MDEIGLFGETVDEWPTRLVLRVQSEGQQRNSRERNPQPCKGGSRLEEGFPGALGRIVSEEMGRVSQGKEMTCTRWGLCKIDK